MKYPPPYNKSFRWPAGMLFVLVLGVAGASIAPSVAWAADVQVKEGQTAVFTLNTRWPANDIFQYRWRYRTEGGTATDGKDYESRTGLVTFGVDEYKKNIVVKTLRDCENEPDEHFKLKFYDFEVKGMFRNTEGWVKPDFDLIRGYPRSFERIGRIQNVQATWSDVLCSRSSGN